jgi:hypothetical protein
MIASITLVGGGVGYSVIPTVVIAAPTSGVRATAHATIGADAVTGFVMDTYGSGYTDVPAVTVTGGNAVTIDIKKCTTAATAPSAGVTVLAATLSNNTAANTPQSGTILATGDSVLAAGDRLGLDMTGTINNYAGGAITVVLQPA